MEGNKIENANVAEEELSEVEILKKLLKDEDKEVKYFKVLSSLMFLFVLAFAVALVIVIPKALKTLDDISQVAISAEATLENANSAIDELTTMSQEVTSLSNQMSTFMTDNTSTLDSAMSNINNIDFAGLNQAIQDLQDAVGPFASFMNRFSR